MAKKVFRASYSVDSEGQGHLRVEIVGTQPTSEVSDEALQESLESSAWEIIRYLEVSVGYPIKEAMFVARTDTIGFGMCGTDGRRYPHWCQNRLYRG